MEIEQSALSRFIEKLPVGVVLTGAAGDIKEMNDAARKILGDMVDVNTYQWKDHSFEVFLLDGSRMPGNQLPVVRKLETREKVLNDTYRVHWTNQGNNANREDLYLKITSTPLQNLSGNAVWIIEDVSAQQRTIEKMRSDIAQYQLMAALSKAFAGNTNDYLAVLKNISQTLAEGVGDACMIHMATEDRSQLQLAAWHHIHTEFMETVTPVLEENMLPVENSFEGKVFRSRQPAVRNVVIREDLPGLQNVLDTVPEAKKPCCQATAPLITPAGVLGTISIWRDHDRPKFFEEDLDVLQELADRAAMAIENARLYAEEVQRNRELNALRDATTALMSTLDLELLLGRILDAAQRAVPSAERGLLHLATPSTGRLELRAMRGFSDPRIRRAGFLKVGIIRSAILDRKPFLIGDILQEDYGQELLEEEITFFRSAIFAPLVLGAEVAGILTLVSSQSYAFTQADLRLLVSFAATTSAALHNAMLHAEVQKIAITDPLTGLYNRRGLEELGQHEVDRFRRFGHPLSLAMLDIDFFKRVNDSYGHGVGDQVLKGLAERCSGIIRQVDTFGRYGGEEFVILLPETDLFQAVNIAERLRYSVAEAPFITDQGAISITISLGVTRASKNLTNLEPLLEQADAALYDAKVKGRNRVEIG